MYKTPIHQWNILMFQRWMRIYEDNYWRDYLVLGHTCSLSLQL